VCRSPAALECIMNKAYEKNIMYVLRTVLGSVRNLWQINTETQVDLVPHTS
jgi:hypothetical protein